MLLKLPVVDSRMGMSNAVRVSIRVRPFNRREIAAQAELSVKVFKKP